MKLKESTAWNCRWFNAVADNQVPALFEMGELEVLFDDSESDYQGSVHVAFLNRDQQVCYIEYSYGSCGGCDSWEDAGGDEAAREEILGGMAVLSPTEFIKFAAAHTRLNRSIEQFVARLFN